MENKQTQIIKLSASSVKTYKQCPKKYYFNYIERAPKKEWAHFDLGNLCHKTLELFHLACMKNAPPKNKWADLMGECFSKARKSYPKMEAPLLIEAKGLLIGYLKNLKNNGLTDVRGVETPFNFTLSEDIHVRGFLDRYDVLEDKRFHILDYKTTKSVDFLDEFQLLVYGLWLKREYPEVKSFRGSYCLLRYDGKLKSFDFSIEDVNKIERELIAYANTIREDNVWTAIPTRLCNWCDFKDICPAQKGW